MEKKQMLYEGKAKKVYSTDVEGTYIVQYKDDATAFNGVKKGTILGKGIVNNKMSNIIFKMLESKGVPTHYIEELNDRETLVKSVKIIPLEVIIRNVAAGSFSKRYGVEEGTPLKSTVLEFCYKNDELGDPMINNSQILALGIATQEELDEIAILAFRINECLIEFFKEIGIRLIDFKLEFGKYKGEIILADEISPDTCRLWDINTNDHLDKDRFRRDLGSVEEAYQEVLRRITNEQ